MNASTITFLTLAYKWGWATIAQFKTAVVNSKITAEQYKTITGEDYSAAATASTTADSSAASTKTGSTT